MTVNEDMLPLGEQYTTAHPLPLGTRVQYRRPLQRVEKVVHHQRPSRRTFRKVWQATKRHEWEDGVVVGVRTLANGPVHWDDYGTYFTADQYVQAYLVAFSLHRNPVHVEYHNVRPVAVTYG